MFNATNKRNVNVLNWILSIYQWYGFVYLSIQASMLRCFIRKIQNGNVCDYCFENWHTKADRPTNLVAFPKRRWICEKLNKSNISSSSEIVADYWTDACFDTTLTIWYYYTIAQLKWSCTETLTKSFPLDQRAYQYKCAKWLNDGLHSMCVAKWIW